MKKYLEDRRLQWFGHLERMEESAGSIKCRTFKVSHSFLRVRPRRKWNEVIRSDLKENKVTWDIAEDRTAWTYEIIVNGCKNEYDDDGSPILLMTF